MRAELGALREQVAQVSDQLLEEESENDRIKQEVLIKIFNCLNSG